MTAGGWWHLYGTVVEGAGYSYQVLLGESHVDEATQRAQHPTIPTRDLLAHGPELTLPLLGSWDHRPTVAEQNAVLAPGMEPSTLADNVDEYGDVVDDCDEDDW